MRALSIRVQMITMPFVRSKGGARSGYALKVLGGRE
jgi:hypothetical protein